MKTTFLLRWATTSMILMSLAASVVATNPASAQTAGCTITGTSRADRLKGTAGADVICGLGGNDTIDGLGGNDVIYGGDGNDTITGGDGADTISGDAGNDRIDGGAGNDSVAGGDGGDTLSGGAGSDRLQGGTGGDTLNGNDGADELLGDAGRDTLNGGLHNDMMNGGPDVDRYDGGAGANLCTRDAGETSVGTCGYDTTSPVVSNVVLSAVSVETATSSALIVLTFDVADTGWCVGLEGVYGQRISWSASENIFGGAPTLVAGDACNGSYRVDYLVPADSRPGEWTFLGVTVNDRAGNTTTLWWDDLAALGYQYLVTIGNSNGYDQHPPTLEGLSISTTGVSLAGDRVVTIDVTFADAEGALALEQAAPVPFFSRQLQEFVYASSVERISGDGFRATYRVAFVFPPTATPGEWTIYGVWAYDTFRNSLVMLPYQLTPTYQTTVTVTP